MSPAFIERFEDTLMSSPKSGRPRWLTLVYLVGFATLAVSMVGASWMLRGNAGTSGTSGSSTAETTAKAYCIGHVDVDGGMTFPYPKQPGEVVEVKVSEGQKVSAGDILFRMDDRLQRKDLKLAEEAVKAAEETLIKAKNLKDMHALKVEGQTRAVAAAKHDLEAARNVAALKKRLAGQSGTGVQKEEAQAADDKARGAEEMVGVEEAKLAAVKLEARDVESAIHLAEIDRAAKQEQRDKAQLAVDETSVTARIDGSVLRLQMHAGDLLPAQPRTPPMIFCPATPRIVRAEVEQEFVNRVAEGQIATITDETASGNGPVWKGKVVHLGDWMAPRRSILPDPSQYHDVRTLECIIAVDANQPPLRIGQRVRVALDNP
jgi:multidrug resistance efflux pump